LCERHAEALVGVGDWHPRARLGLGCWSSSGRWQAANSGPHRRNAVEVERRTPARAAMALSEGPRRPERPCNSTALSVMRRRVASSSSARRCLRTDAFDRAWMFAQY